VSSGFHCEEGRAANGEPVIVCDVCDQPDQRVAKRKEPEAFAPGSLGQPILIAQDVQAEGTIRDGNPRIGKLTQSGNCVGIRAYDNQHRRHRWRG
jgi:hypothetical protein